MITIAKVFKMFPIRNMQASKSDSLDKTQTKTITSCFFEGIQEGCNAFTKGMGYKTKDKT